MNKHLLNSLRKSDISNLYAIATSSIDSRIGLRSSGKVSESDRTELAQLYRHIYKLEKKDLIKFIEFHTDEYLKEK